jgi:hypothetical protein
MIKFVIGMKRARKWRQIHVIVTKVATFKTSEAYGRAILKCALKRDVE